MLIIIVKTLFDFRQALEETPHLQKFEVFLNFQRSEKTTRSQYIREVILNLAVIL